MKIIILILTLGLFLSACSGLPDKLIISEGMNLSQAQEILEAIKAQPSGKGLVSELYFDVSSEFDREGVAKWYLLPDNSHLGLYSLEILKDDEQPLSYDAKKDFIINQIMLGEINRGYEGRLKWDMQIKILFNTLNLRNHLKQSENPLFQLGKIEVGDLFHDAIAKMKEICAVDSEKTHDYIYMPNHIYHWLKLDNNLSIEILGENKTTSGELVVVQIRVSNSTQLFNLDRESWYHVQSVRYAAYGTRFWGIDVETSYFNIYKGMQLKDALTTLRTANVRELPVQSGEADELKQKIDKPKFLDAYKRELSIRKFQLKPEIELIIASIEILEGSYETIVGIYLDANVPKFKEDNTKKIWVEFEFLDIINPVRTDWFEKFIK